MNAELTRCGFRCDLCPAYRSNVEKETTNLSWVAATWQKAFDFYLEPEEMICDGCMAEDGVLLDVNCQVRPCVQARGFHDCSQCENYICEKLQTRLIEYDALVREKGDIFTPEERLCCIRPFENKPRLEALRKK